MIDAFNNSLTRGAAAYSLHPEQRLWITIEKDFASYE
jgi:hypothetical protein